MKILIINSSYRRDGNTQRILECFKEEYLSCAKKHDVDVEFETVFLSHENIQLCRGCRLCFDKGEEKCPLKDEVLVIKEKIHAADAIVLSSPVYVEDVNGFMKNWIDRMAFNCHRPSLCGKPAIVLTTSGSYSSDHSLRTMIRAFNAWGGIVVAKGKFTTGALMEKDEAKARHSSRIKVLAEKLFNKLNKGEAVFPSVYSLLAFKVQQRYWQKTKYTESYDYAYWKKKGWLKDGCTYYSEHGAGWFKTRLAGILGNFAALFLS